MIPKLTISILIEISLTVGNAYGSTSKTAGLSFSADCTTTTNQNNALLQNHENLTQKQVADCLKHFGFQFDLQEAMLRRIRVTEKQK